jgi:hypothetical protein
MKSETRRNREAAALIAFSESFDKRGNPKPIPHLRWRKKWSEPAQHYWWRIHANLLHRCRLWLRAGLGELPFLNLRRIEREERQARRAWKEEYRKDLAEFRRGKVAWAEGLTVGHGEEGA